MADQIVVVKTCTPDILSRKMAGTAKCLGIWGTGEGVKVQGKSFQSGVDRTMISVLLVLHRPSIGFFSVSVIWYRWSGSGMIVDVVVAYYPAELAGESRWRLLTLG